MTFDIRPRCYLAIALLVSMSLVQGEKTQPDQIKRLKRDTLPEASNSDFTDGGQDGVDLRTDGQNGDLGAEFDENGYLEDDNVDFVRRAPLFSHNFVGKRLSRNTYSRNLWKRIASQSLAIRAPHYSHSFVGKRALDGEIYDGNDNLDDIPVSIAPGSSHHSIKKRSAPLPTSYSQSLHDSLNGFQSDSSVSLRGNEPAHNLVKRSSEDEKRSHSFGHSFVGKRAPRFGHSFVGKRAPSFGHSFVGKRAPSFGHSFVGKRAPSFGHSFVGKRAPRFGHTFIGKREDHDDNDDDESSSVVKDDTDILDDEITSYELPEQNYFDLDDDLTDDSTEVIEKRQQRKNKNPLSLLGKRPSFTHSFVGKRAPRFGHSFVGKRGPSFGHSFVGKRAPGFGHSFVGKRAPGFGHSFVGKRAPGFGHSFVGKRPGFSHSFVGKRGPGFGHSFVGKREDDTTSTLFPENDLNEAFNSVSIPEELFITDKNDSSLPEDMAGKSNTESYQDDSAIFEISDNRQPGFSHAFEGKRSPRFGHSFVGKRAPGFGHSFVGKRAPGFGHSFVGKRAPGFGHSFVGKRAPGFGHSFVGKRAPGFGHSFVGKRAPGFGHSFVGKRAPGFGHSFVGKRAPGFGHSFVGKRAPGFGHSFVGKRAPGFGHSFVGKRAPGFGHSFVGKREDDVDEDVYVDDDLENDDTRSLLEFIDAEERAANEEQENGSHDVNSSKISNI